MNPLKFVFLGIEDCLYVYVYVPGDRVDPNALMDVIVHIHGGAFMLGAPKYMAGPEFLMDRDVIVVSFNYRLGILGKFQVNSPKQHLFNNYRFLRIFKY